MLDAFGKTLVASEQKAKKLGREWDLTIEQLMDKMLLVICSIL